MLYRPFSLIKDKFLKTKSIECLKFLLECWNCCRTIAIREVFFEWANKSPSNRHFFFFYHFHLTQSKWLPIQPRCWDCGEMCGNKHSKSANIKYLNLCNFLHYNCKLFSTILFNVWKKVFNLLIRLLKYIDNFPFVSTILLCLNNSTNKVIDIIKCVRFGNKGIQISFL